MFNIVEEWMNVNTLKLNVNKTKNMITRNGGKKYLEILR